MEEEELRIGNLVYKINRTGEVHMPNEIPLVIWGIGKFESYVRLTEGNLLSLRPPSAVRNSDISPIPLTEEWLKKFGFIYQGGDGYSCNEKSTLLFYFSLRNGLMPQLFYRNTIESDNVKGCKYVHQFQNLFFALTGTELTMKEEVSLSFEKPRRVHDTEKVLSSKITYRRPNLFKRIMYWMGLMKDPRYNGSRKDLIINDEAGMWDNKYNNGK